MKMYKQALALGLMICATGTYADGLRPTALMTDLMTDTRTVWQGGYPSSAQLNDVTTAWKRAEARGLQSIPLQVATIHSATPMLGWKLEGEGTQRAFRILVASKPELLTEEKADIWDSGRREGTSCSGIRMEGKALVPKQIYYWTVQVWDAQDQPSAYATPSAFLTDPNLDNEFPRYPLCKTNEHPVSVSNGLYDFGKAAFGQLQLTVKSDVADTLTLRIGEAQADGHVNRRPGGTIRYTEVQLPVQRGCRNYQVTFRPDGRNAMIKKEGQDVRPVLMPDYIGEVYPFRYLEIESRHGAVAQQVERAAVHYRWNEEGASFRSSDDILNQVWDLCRYSIKATSFAGVYVDGDRERIPYEADAYINQLSHYCSDEDYTMARYTVDYLCKNATWPTECILQALIMAWYDYEYTGDTLLIARNYNTLKARTLELLTQPNGLISTRVGIQPSELLRACGYYGRQINDIVDWPQSGAFGIGKEEAGEADGFQHKTYNTVVNAFHYEALVLMSRIAKALGHTADQTHYQQQAEKVKTAINTLLYDAEKGCYFDGLETDHHSLHASMMPLAFGIVPKERQAEVMKFIQSRGMACSVYGAQILMDALYEAGAADYALQLLTDQGPRSWYNMIKVGSTVTLEAWDAKFKPNLDWNHAWGSAPANIIPRRLMGVMPLEAGWSRLQIKPQIGSLAWAEAKVPTIRGQVEVRAEQSDKQYTLAVSVPTGCVAEVAIPCATKKYKLQLDGSKCRSKYQDGFVRLTLNGGKHTISLTK